MLLAGSGPLLPEPRYLQSRREVAGSRHARAAVCPRRGPSRSCPYRVPTHSGRPPVAAIFSVPRGTTHRAARRPVPSPAAAAESPAAPQAAVRPPRAGGVFGCSIPARAARQGSEGRPCTRSLPARAGRLVRAQGRGRRGPVRRPTHDAVGSAGWTP